MKKFTFRLQTKMDINTRQKQEAWEEYLAAVHRENEAVKQLNQMKLKAQQVKNQIKNLTKGEFLPAKLAMLNDYLSVLNAEKVAQQNKLDILHQETEKVQRKLLEISREVKMMEKLKTRGWQQYQQELQKAEQTELDEVSGVSYFRKTNPDI